MYRKKNNTKNGEKKKEGKNDKVPAGRDYTLAPHHRD